MSSIASSSSSSSASDSSSDDDMSCDDNSSSSSQDSMTTNVRYVSEMNNNQKFENTFSTTNNSINSNIYDFNSNNESLISDNLLSSGLTHHKSTGSALSGGLLFSNSSLLSSDLSLSLNKSSKPKTDSSSAKTPRKRCKKFLLSYFFDWLITVLHFCFTWSHYANFAHKSEVSYFWLLQMSGDLTVGTIHYATPYL